MLFQIRDFLIQTDITLSMQSKDGRINSAFNEDEIFKLIEQNFSINRPKIRDWVDFSFEWGGAFIL